MLCREYLLYFLVIFFCFLCLYTNILLTNSDTRILFCIPEILNLFSSNFLIISASSLITMLYKKHNIRHPYLTSFSIFIAFGSILFTKTIIFAFLYNSLILNIKAYRKLNFSNVFHK